MGNARGKYLMDNNFIVDDVYIGRQPILDRDNNIVAYDILYRQSKVFNYCESGLDNFEITAKVLSIALNNIGINKLVDNKKGLINVDEALLNHSIINNIPSDKFYLELLESTDITNSLIDKMDELIGEGYIFVLDDFTFSKDNFEKYKILFSRVKYIKVDLQTNSMANMELIVKNLKRFDLKFLAEKVETKEEFEALKNIGYELFQGYYFAKPDILSTKKLDPATIEILNILGMICNNKDINDIVKKIEQYPMISINLLKFLNSAYFSFHENIHSIKQAVTLLGMKKLKNWLILLLYINNEKNPYNNPLFMMIKNRSNFMVEIVKYTKYNNEENQEIVYLTGLLSKIDIVLNSSLEEALNELHIDKIVQDAIIKKQGLAGDILSLAEANENNDSEKMDKLLEKLSLSLKDLTNANLKSYLAKI